MELVLFLTLLLIFLLVCHEILRRHKMFAGLVFLLGPFVLLPLAFQQDNSIFVWLKVYSVSFGSLWLILCCLTELGQKKWAIWLLWAFFALNILEAVLESFKVGGLLNYLNMIPGILLICTLPFPNEISVDKKPTRDLLWNTSMFWIIGYTLWNWVFLYMNWPAFCLMHIPVLLAPLLVSLVNNKLWIQARAFTLGIYLLIHFSYDAVFKPIHFSGSVNPEIAGVVVGAAVIWMVFYFIYFIKSRV